MKFFSKHSRGTAFTLVELLVVIAVMGGLVALLMPALQAVRAAATRTRCGNNLKQNTLAVLVYHDMYRKLPVGSLPGWPTSVAWFAEVDWSNNTADPTKGAISRFIEQSQVVLRCPSMDTINYLYGGETGGYGYNLNLGATLYPPPLFAPVVVARKLSYFRSTTRTLVFTDAARIQLPWAGDPVLKATENMYLQGPDDLELYTEPGTHFRHGDIANVSFLDGHVDGMMRADVPFPGHWPLEAVQLADDLKIGYVAETSVEMYRPQ
ncbi:MAG: DUF1559 domain-containing protein [Planctomycetales bacterium]|nr:DUF1559 domain-containing protein [Planctomycetales bacterium]NIM09935.1 DUF1559 domain-containing protein [Planctomycetales bacterium]NIN09375.1 DUF1559 domain-containing protein [Planctomycetales bacterium]NIN78482.1 DUF1559 domain-containing protein [Planctomycetales bacterium]NIO35674.1 DUF1559 domain-containing protein [Planctomycetales bacterium]